MKRGKYKINEEGGRKMSVIVVDRKTDNIIGELNSSNGLLSALYKRKKEKDEMTLDVELVYTDSHLIKKGNSLVIQDEEGLLREFEIEDYEEVDGETVYVNCLPTYLNDIGLSKPILSSRDLNSLSTGELVTELLDETQWEVGEIVSAGSMPFIREKNEYPLDLINRLKEQRDLVVDYHVEIIRGSIRRRIVDVRFPKEINNGKEIERGKDLISLKRRESMADTRTAVLVTGKVTDKAKDEDGNDVEIERELSVEVVNDEIQNKIGLPGDYKWDILETDLGTEEELREEGNEYLKEVGRLYEGFEIDVEDLSSLYKHEDVKFGDIVHIKDYNFEPELIIRGEVVEVEYDVSDSSTKKYLVGEAVRLKTRIDDISDLLDRHSNMINSNSESQRKMIDRLVEIGGPIDKEGSGEIVYENIIIGNNIVGASGGAFEHLHYDDMLGIRATSTSTSTDNLGPQRSEGYELMRVRNGKFERGKIYTLRFRVKADTTLSVRLSEEISSVAYVLVDGNRLTSENAYTVASYFPYSVVSVGATGSGWKTVELVFIRNNYGSSRDEYAGTITMGTSEPQTEVEFKDYIVYEGTPIYSIDNRFNENDFDTADTSTMYEWESIPGGVRVKKENDMRQNGSQRLASVVFRNPSGDAQVVQVKMKLKVRRIEHGTRRWEIRMGGGGLEHLTGATNRQQNMYLHSKDEEMLKVISSSNTPTSQKAYLSDSVVPDEIEYDISFIMVVGHGTDHRLRFDSWASLNPGKYSVDFTDVTVYNGVAPKGVVREDETPDHEVIPDLTNQLGVINHKLNQKSDKGHSHEASEVVGLSDGIRGEVESMGYMKKEEVEEMNWEMESVSGLTSALDGKSSVGHSHVINDVDGLRDILDGILQEIEDLKG